MKLTAGELHDAVVALTGIMNRPRQIPQLAKFRIAKMHSALESAFEQIESARAALVQQYGQEVFQDEAKTVPGGWQVVPGTEGFANYLKEWNAIRAQEFEVNVIPMTLESLGNELGAIEATEFKLLDKFIVESNPVPPIVHQGTA